jgi:hypothetical protein
MPEAPVTSEPLTIPKLVSHNTEALACLHEAGHAVAATLVTATVVDMELYPDDQRPYGRTRIDRNDFQRPMIAIGGFAVERRLWEDRRLVDAAGNLLTEKDMLTAAAGNADDDRISYFGGDYRKENGCWPREMDLKFMMAARDLGHRLNMQLIERSDVRRDCQTSLQPARFWSRSGTASR